MPWDETLRDVWEAAGYNRFGGSVCITPPPTSEHLRVYHLTAADHAVSDIALSRLKVARFSDANDPFELIGLNFRERNIRKVVRDFKSTKDATTGLLCFSANWTNPVLWSHYGIRHTGVCLGFDLSKEYLSPQFVEYESERITAALAGDGSPLDLSDELKEKLLRTKYRDWTYEEEIRVFIELKNAIVEGRLCFFPFSKNLRLAEVILGPQCQLSIDHVRDLVDARHPNVLTYQARLAFKKFSVVPKESTLKEPFGSALRR
jgi:hypothetical protein